MDSSRLTSASTDRFVPLLPAFLSLWIAATAASESLCADPPDLSPGPLQVPAASLRSWAEEEQDEGDLAGSDGGSLVLLSRTDVTVRKGAILQTRTWTISLLLTQEAVRESIRLETGWSPWHSDRPVMAARIIQPDGREIQMDDSKAIEQSDGGQSSDTIDDTKRLVMLLVGLRIGSIIETVETVDYRSSLPDSFVHSYLLAGFAPIAVSQLVVKAEPGAGFQWEVPGGGFTPQVQRRASDASGYRELVFELKPAKGILDYWQVSSGPDHSALPLVRIGVPSRWDKVAKSYQNMVAPQIDQAQAVAELLTAGIDPEASDQQKVDQCVARLRQAVVYTGVEFGINRIVPYAAEEIVSRGFGDCKDQSMLLVAMLRNLNLDSQMVLLHSGSGLDVSPSLPAISGFNHVIVRVGGETPIWVDPAAAGFPSGLLPTECYNRRCLIIDDQTTELARTPRMKPNDDVFHTASEIRADSSGFGTITTTTRYERIASLRILAGAPEADNSDALNAYMANLFDATADNTTTTYDEKNGGTLQVIATQEPQQIAQSDSTRAAYAFDLRAVFQSIPPVFFSPTAIAALNGGASPNAPAQDDEDATDSRTNPVVVTSAYRERHDFVLSYPSFLRANSLPGSFQRQMGPISIRFDTRLTPAPTTNRTQISLSCEVIVDPAAAPVQAKELRTIQAELEAYATEASPLSGVIVLADAESSQWFRRGGLAAVIGLARRCEAHPDDAYAVARLAVALGAASLLDAAKAKAHAAVEMSPESPLVLQLVESIFILGDDGAVARAGFDLQALRKIARTYHAQYPQDASNLNFARAFLLNEHGYRETEPAECQQAITILRPLAESSALDTEFRDQAAVHLATVFLMLGQDQEVVEIVSRISPQTTGGVDGLRFLAAVIRGEDLARWLERHQAPQPGAATDGRAVAHGCNLATTAGRWDLLEKFGAELEQQDLSENLPEWHQFLQIDREPTELDEADPVSVARTGLGRLLTGHEHPLYYWPNTAGDLNAATGSALQQHLSATVGNADSWSPEALHGLLQRLEIIAQSDSLGGQRLTFASVLDFGLEPTVYVVPVDEDSYRWFFAEDSRALVQWTQNLLESQHIDQAREALDRLSTLAGPLPWFDQLAGSPAARAWSMLRKEGEEEMGVALALFSLEFAPGTGSTARAVDTAESAALGDEYARVQTQLWRSLDRYYSESGNPSRRRDMIQRLLKKYPDQSVYFGQLASLARETDSVEDCRAFFEQIAADQRPVSRQMCDFFLLAETGPFAEILERYDQLDEDLENYKSFIANVMAWAALQRNADVDLLRELESRLAPTIRLKHEPDAAHTLACLQAAMGQSEQAYETLRESGWTGASRMAGQLYAFGAVCQAIGLDDAARAYYQATVDEFSTSSNAALARIRLEEQE